MIDYKTLHRCIDILAELNSSATRKEDKERILEIGYIIKQELDLVEKWENSNNKRIDRKNVQLNPEKLLEDNIQLFRDNEKLTQCANSLEKNLKSQIPEIEKQIAIIKEKIDILNNFLNTNLR